MILQIDHAGENVYQQEFPCTYQKHHEIYENVLVMNPTKAILLLHNLENSENFRSCFLRRNPGLVLKINLTTPTSIASIDFKSCDLAQRKLWEQIELEDALHWLSTLGGAYSNLGDHSLTFAKRAGDNAFRQMKIALRSSDPYVLNKCWLFVAMSLMQQGQLQKSKYIIYQIHNSVKEHDPVLSRMCKGIWARLQYTWKKKIKDKN